MSELITPIPPVAPKENRRNIGALWSKLNGAGEKFLSGKINLKNITGVDEEVSVFVFKNVKKQDRSPDYSVVLAQDEIAKRLPPEMKREEAW